MINMEKKFLFIVSKPPHSSASAKESTDAIMAACAFGQDVSVLATGDGLYQFTKNQDPSDLKLKDTAAMLESLPLYGTEEIIVIKEDLAIRELASDNFVLPVKTINTDGIRELIKHSDIVLNY